jgi:formylglycine-generating enzyme required for sulfatase activity
MYDTILKKVHTNMQLNQKYYQRTYNMTIANKNKKGTGHRSVIPEKANILWRCTMVLRMLLILVAVVALSVSGCSKEEPTVGEVAEQAPKDAEAVAEETQPVVDDGVIDITWVQKSLSPSDYNIYMSKYETTNAQFAQYLNEAIASNDIRVEGIHVKGNSGPYSGQNYYYLEGSGNTRNGATDGGAARINWTNRSFTVDSGFNNHPVTYVSWYGATAFASFYGWRLPTEVEWQMIADYNGSYTFGCGKSINNSIANYYGSTHPHGTTSVGAFGTYGHGICDMAGNVKEWTENCKYGDYDPEFRILCGGSWLSEDLRGEEEAIRRLFRHPCDVSSRTHHLPSEMWEYIGFRVCRTDQKISPEQIDILKDSDEAVHDSTAGTLGTIEFADIESIIAALRDSDETVRNSAAVALGEIGTSNVGSLIAALKTVNSVFICRQKMAVVWDTTPDGPGWSGIQHMYFVGDENYLRPAKLPIRVFVICADQPYTQPFIKSLPPLKKGCAYFQYTSDPPKYILICNIDIEASDADLLAMFGKSGWVMRSWPDGKGHGGYYIETRRIGE